MRTSASKFSLALAVVSVLAASGTALAASPKLKGTYAETGENVCLVSMTVRGTPGGPVPVVPSGFNAETLTPNPGAFTSLLLSSYHGTRTFDGEGSGTLHGRNASISSSPNIFPNAFAPSASTVDIAGTFTYEVAPDGTISTADDTLQNILAGPRTGQSATNSFSLTGRASHNRHSLILATDASQIETVVISNGDVQERICHRSRTLVRTDD